VTFGVAQGGVGEVGLSIKAASPNAPACPKCLQHLLRNCAVSNSSATCKKSLTPDCTTATATHQIHLHFPIANNGLDYSLHGTLSVSTAFDGRSFGIKHSRRLASNYHRCICICSSSSGVPIPHLRSPFMGVACRGIC
jgi:hypothetical protein